MIEFSDALIEARAEAGAQERARLAREIHDGVAQDLAGIGYRLDGLATAPGLTPDERSEIRDIRISLSESLNTLRRSIFDLRSSEIDFPMEIQSFLKAIESKGVAVSFNCDSNVATLDSLSARQLHAIAIEALSNVVHHANATRISFNFAGRADSYQMTIEDNGNGNVEAKDFSYGLATMNERAELIGARCAVANLKTGGTIISIKSISS